MVDKAIYISYFPILLQSADLANNFKNAEMCRN